MTKRLYIAGLVTLIGFPLLGGLVLWWFVEDPMATMLRSTAPWWQQVLVGAATGIALGAGGRWIIDRGFMRNIRIKYAGLVRGLGLRPWSIVFLSLCAGFGEELLFRGALQPLMGLWLTAVIFVAIHGYLDPRNWRISVYGLYMTAGIAVLGYLTELQGIWAACTAHAFLDMVLFRYLVRGVKLPKPGLHAQYPTISSPSPTSSTSPPETPAPNPETPSSEPTKPEHELS